MRRIDRSAALGALTMMGLVSGCAPVARAFDAEVREELDRHPPSTEFTLSGDELRRLPAPVRRYLAAAGYVGRGPFSNAEIVWTTSAIRLGPDRGWLPLRTRQFNSVPEPVRIAHMRARLFRLLPFEGKDSYRNGGGSMRMVLLGGLEVGDTRGREMDQSALVTVLAEALVVPGYVLAPYITWEAVDDSTARATIQHGRTRASGLFRFDPDGDRVRFETADRYYAASDGDYRLVPWTAEMSQFVDDAGIRRPGAMRAVWHLEDADFEYFRGTIGAIRYDLAAW